MINWDKTLVESNFQMRKAIAFTGDLRTGEWPGRMVEVNGGIVKIEPFAIMAVRS